MNSTRNKQPLFRLQGFGHSRGKTMMPMAIMAAIAIAIPAMSNAQGWIGNSSTNTLIPYNSSLGLTPLNVGIGTSTPSEQLHTNAGVRFQGLTNDNTVTKIVGQDANGKLFWRDYSTFNQGNFWSLTGNGGTSPGTNFLGTTDGNRLVFKTEGIERATILPNLGKGYVGIGTSAPGARLHVYDGAPVTIAQMALNTYETGVVEGNRDTKFGVYNAVPGIFGSSSKSGAAIAFGYTSSFLTYAGDLNQYYPGYEMQYLAVPTTNSGKNDNTILRFNKLVRDQLGGVVLSKSTQNEAIIYEGNVGIHLGPPNGQPKLPTARLHVDCAISSGSSSGLRFENLQQGEGHILVIDDSGYVYFANQQAQIANPPSDPDVNKKIEKLDQEIKVLKTALETLKNTAMANSVSNKMFSVYPNPAQKVVNIKFIGEARNFSTANYSIFSVASGATISKGSISTENMKIQLDNAQSGDYIISFYSNDEKLLQAEKLVLVN